MKTSFLKSRGFTLIELLVVIAIIAILSGIVMTSIAGSRGKARDSKRISDLGQIQLALELYFDRCKAYPNSLSSSASCQTSNGTVRLSAYIDPIPKGPSGETYEYYPYTSTYTDYYLRTVLESPNEVVRDGLSAKPSWGPSNAICSNASGSKNYCIGPK